MNVYIYGIVGHAGAVEMPLDDLDIDELEVGREFFYGGKIYEVRSMYGSDDNVRLNVVLALDPAETPRV